MDSKYKNLRKQSLTGAGRGNPWTIENLKDGFDYFFELNGHYPSSLEVDKFEYLPSRKSLERSFGGLPKVKELLQLDAPYDLTKGSVRSEKAKEADRRARVYEEEFFLFLIKNLPEVRVHEQKVIRPGNVSCDFFIYTSEKDGIVIDLFYAQDMISVRGVINIKVKRYLSIKKPVYFVLVGNNKIFQSEIDSMLLKKKSILPENISVLTEKTFKDDLNKFIN